MRASFIRATALASGLLLVSSVSISAQTYAFTNFVGQPGGVGNADGTGSAARFYSPRSVAVDSDGNVIVADRDNHTIRKVSASGVVTTLAGKAGISGSADGTGSAARFRYPTGVAVDGAGNVFVADRDNNTIRRVTPAGLVTTMAGNPAAYGSDDGTGSAARFNHPFGVAVDTNGNVFVADADNHTIRKVSASRVVTTLAGSAGASGSADGTGIAARFHGPTGVAVDDAGNVLVADQLNHTVRKVSATGLVTTLAGSAGVPGSADGTGSAARFYYPTSVALDTSSNVFVADQFNHTVRKVSAAGVVSTLAGSAGSPGSDDGTGSAARFHNPAGVAVGDAGDVFVADYTNNVIRKVSAAGVVTTLAGSAGCPGSADGTGSAARLNGPDGVAVDSYGNLYVADTLNNTIRKVTPDGMVITLAGIAQQPGWQDGTGSAARFELPEGLAVDKLGNIYVADSQYSTIRKVTPSGVVTTFVGINAFFYGPSAVAVDSAGNVYVADTMNNAIRKVTPDGVVTTLAGSAGSSGSADGTGGAARFNEPSGVAVNTLCNVYVADTGNHTIRKVTPLGVVTTLAGSAGQSGSADGPGSAARFYYPFAVALDSAGNLYVADMGNDTIRKMTPDGVVTTIAGSAGQSGGADGISSAARFNWPCGLTVDSAGSLFVADTRNNRISKGVLVAQAPMITQQPANQTVTAGDTASICVSAVGTPPLSYQWFKNGVNVPNATNSTLKLSNAQPSNSGNYIVVVANSYGNLTSSNAILTVIPRPANDLFANAIVITGLTNSLTASNVNATKEAGEPNHAGNPGGTSVWWTWTAATDAAATLDTIGSSLDTLLAVYTGSAVTNLALVAGDHGSGPNGSSRLTFDAAAGITYQIAIDGYNGATGNIVLHLNASAILSPWVTAQPQDRTVDDGMGVTFAVSAMGTGPLRFQWKFNGWSIPGATNAALMLSSVHLADAGSYTVDVSNREGSVASQPAILTVEPIDDGGSIPPGAYWWEQLNTAPAGVIPTPTNGIGSFPGDMTCLNKYRGKWIVQRDPSEGGIGGAEITAAKRLWVWTQSGPEAPAWSVKSGSSLFTSSCSTVPLSPGLHLGFTVWCSATWPRPAGVSVYKLGGIAVAVMAVDAQTLTNIARNFYLLDHDDDFLQSEVAPSPIIPYKKVISLASSGIYELDLWSDFSVALGREPSGMVIGVVELIVRGDHWSGSATADAPVEAVFDDLWLGPGQVTAPSIIVQPQSQTVAEGTNVTFSVTATGTAPLRYQWQFNATKVPGATNTTLTLPNVQLVNAGSYTVLVNNAGGTTNSQSATLTVCAGPVTTPSLSGAFFGPDGFHFGINDMITGRVYRIQVTTNLLSPQWTDMDVISNAQGSAQFVDPAVRSIPKRFYRAVTP
jgi:hypothetical protein